jgi:hypothetical protein
LDAFRNKLSAARVVKFWESDDGLVSDVVLSLSQALRVHPAIGWVRASSSNNEALLAQLNSIRNENDELKLRLETVSDSLIDKNYSPPTDFASGFDQIEITGYYWERGQRLIWKADYSVDHLFSLIGPDVVSPTLETAAIVHLQRKISRLHPQLHASSSPFQLDKQCAQSIGLHLHALRLICVEARENDGVYWTITSAGFDHLTQLLAFRKPV